MKSSFIRLLVKEGSPPLASGQESIGHIIFLQPFEGPRRHTELMIRMSSLTCPELLNRTVIVTPRQRRQSFNDISTEIPFEVKIRLIACHHGDDVAQGMGTIQYLEPHERPGTSRPDREWATVPAPREICPGNLDELMTTIEDVVTGNHHILLLFDSDLNKMHDRFLERFTLTRDPTDLVILIRGEKVKSSKGLYSELSLAVPLASYMGSNLDAMSDILRCEALAQDTNSRTYWIWRNAHVLYQKNPDSFKAILQAMAEDAHENSLGFLGPKGEVISPVFDWQPQPVTMLLTGSWEAMGDESMREDSFLYLLPFSEEIFRPFLTTRIQSIRVSRRITE